MMKVVPATRTVLVELLVKFVLYTTACVQYQCRCTHRVPSVRPVASVNVQTCRVFVSKFPVHKIRTVPKVRLQLAQVNLTLGWEGHVFYPFGMYSLNHFLCFAFLSCDHE